MVDTVVRTDETGLHAEDCECVRCDAGYRPTDLERLAARRALALQRAALAKREAAQTAPPLPRYRREEWRPIKKPTPEQFEELRQLREAMKNDLARKD